MSDSKSPDWSRLPHDPLRFFGLSDRFERRDLKRAYGSLIRQFKPETHPDEFQKIRAAYEHLDNAIRYDNRQRATDAVRLAWDAEPTEVPKNKDAVRRGPSGSRKRPHVSRDSDTRGPSAIDLAITQTRSQYQQLAAKSDRSPQEYYRLAVLSDLVDADSGGAKFLSWLLEGLKSHLNDPGLLALVRQYLQSEVSTEDASGILPAVAAATKSPVFYQISEALWERLFREGKTDFALELLDQCESDIRHHDSHERCVFLLRLLKTAIWEAPAGWTDERIAELESHSQQMNYQMLNDLDLATLLRSYCDAREERLYGSETRARIDVILRNFCMSDGPAAIALMTGELSRLALDSGALRSAFPMTSQRDESATFLMVLVATEDLQQTTGLVFSEDEHNQHDQLADAAFDDLSPYFINAEDIIARGIRYKYQYFPALIGFGIWGMINVILVALAGFTLGPNSPVAPLLVLACPISYLLAYVYYVHPRHMRPRIEVAAQRRWWRYYEDHWRERIFRYIQSCGEHPNVALQRLREAGIRRGEVYWAKLVAGFSEKDVGLLIFAHAQPFLV